MSTAMFKRILYATDMTDSSIVAAHFALCISNDYNAHLTILNVVPDEVEEMSANMNYDLSAHYESEQLNTFNEAEKRAVNAELVERIKNLCDKLKAQINGCLVCPDISIRAGNTVEQILLEAEQDGSDLIITGTSRHSVFDNLLLGNVAKELVQKSPVPVITIPLAENLSSSERSASQLTQAVEDEPKLCS